MRSNLGRHGEARRRLPGSPHFLQQLPAVQLHSREMVRALPAVALAGVRAVRPVQSPYHSPCSDREVSVRVIVRNMPRGPSRPRADEGLAMPPEPPCAAPQFRSHWSSSGGDRRARLVERPPSSTSTRASDHSSRGRAEAREHLSPRAASSSSGPGVSMAWPGRMVSPPGYP